MKNEYHVLNLGAGVQSTFLYLAWTTLELPPLDAAIFADTQEEPEEVYAHLAWLQSLGSWPILKVTKSKLGNDLVHGVNSTGQRFASIPAYTTDGLSAAGMTRRQCSREYKIEVIQRAVRQQVLGLLPKQRVPRGVAVWQYFGISLDEAGRAMRLGRADCPAYVKRQFPLVEKFITRAHCLNWLQGRVPHQTPRSACVFCPYHSDDEWLRIKANEQDWKRAVEIDEALRGTVANRDMDQTMYLHRSCQPLVQIDFKPAEHPLERQANFNFAPECLGVCGI